MKLNVVNSTKFSKATYILRKRWSFSCIHDWWKQKIMSSSITCKRT